MSRNKINLPNPKAQAGPNAKKRQSNGKESNPKIGLQYLTKTENSPRLLELHINTDNE